MIKSRALLVNSKHHGVAELIINCISTDSEVSSQVAMLATHISDFTERNTDGDYWLFLQ
jgi:hypothetical protein